MQHVRVHRTWDAQELLVTLAERSLVQLVTKAPDSGQPPRRDVALHDLVYDYGRQLSGDPSHIINLTGSLVGGRLISDHLPVVWDITIG